MGWTQEPCHETEDDEQTSRRTLIKTEKIMVNRECVIVFLLAGIHIHKQLQRCTTILFSKFR